MIKIVKIKLEQKDIEDCIKAKIHNISNFDWGKFKDISIEVELPLESFLSTAKPIISVKPTHMPEPEVPQPVSRNVMTSQRPTLPRI